MLFPIVSDPADDEPRLHRAHPEELHWRADPPAWPGKTDSAHRRLYPHLTQQFCCMQCQAIPCPYDHEKDQQLRLNDMSFVESLVSDKKLLQQTLEQKEQEITKLKESLQRWHSDQRTFEKQLEEVEQANRVLQAETNTLQKETVRLRALTGQQGRELTGMKKEIERLETIEQAAAQFAVERSKLVEDAAVMKQTINDNTREMNKLSQENTSIRSQYNESVKRVDALQADITFLQEQVDDVTKAYEEQIAKNTQQVEQELARLREEVTEKDALLTKLIQYGSDVEITSRPSSAVLHRSKEEEEEDEKIKELEALVQAYCSEIETLKNQLAADRRFRMYVEVVRERNVLREANENLTRKLDEFCPPPTLPTLKSPSEIGRGGGSKRRQDSSVGRKLPPNAIASGPMAMIPPPPVLKIDLPVLRILGNSQASRDSLENNMTSKLSRLTRRPQEV